MSIKWKNKKCVPCEGGVDPLQLKEIRLYLESLPGWTLAADEKSIQKKYVFKDFSAALQFVNRVGELAEKEGHHPDIYLHDWNKVTVTLSTHAIKGLHMNDFVVGVKIEDLLPNAVRVKKLKLLCRTK
jgi:4a-hydroxytetrahydrobiopterin dehydratase